MTKEEKLKRWIKQEGISKKDFAANIGIAYSALNTYLNRKFTMGFLEKVVANYPEIDMNWLLKDQDQEYEIKQELPFVSEPNEIAEQLIKIAENIKQL